jgi:hypothetical protein
MFPSLVMPGIAAQLLEHWQHKRFVPYVRQMSSECPGICQTAAQHGNNHHVNAPAWFAGTTGQLTSCSQDKITYCTDDL